MTDFWLILNNEVNRNLFWLLIKRKIFQKCTNIFHIVFNSRMNFYRKYHCLFSIRISGDNLESLSLIKVSKRFEIYNWMNNPGSTLRLEWRKYRSKPGKSTAILKKKKKMKMKKNKKSKAADRRWAVQLWERVDSCNGIEINLRLWERKRGKRKRGKRKREKGKENKRNILDVFWERWGCQETYRVDCPSISFFVNVIRLGLLSQKISFSRSRHSLPSFDVRFGLRGHQLVHVETRWQSGV